MSISKIKIYASVEVPINLSCLLVSQLATPTNSSQSDTLQVTSPQFVIHIKFWYILGSPKPLNGKPSETSTHHSLHISF